MNQRRFSVLLLAAFLLCSLACCSKKPTLPSSSSEPEPTNFPVTVGDADLSEEPTSVISLSPGLTELVFDMGYSGKIIGVSDYCDYPARETANRQKCGSVLSPNLTYIKKLSPDLVLISSPLPESDLIALQQADIQVLLLPYAESLDDWQENCTLLATALSGKLDGPALAQAYWSEKESLLSDASSRLGNQSPLRAILLREMSYGMATGDTFEQELFDLLGLVNDGENYTNWLYDSDDVAILEPDVIYADNSIRPAEIKTSYVYKPVAASKNDRIMNVDMTIFERQSPRMFELLVSMAEFAYGSPDAT